MNARLHPDEVLYQGAGKPFPALNACEHYAGNEKLIRKALELQAELGPVFDITGDCEDGAPVGGEAEHFEAVQRPSGRGHGTILPGRGVEA